MLTKNSPLIQLLSDKVIIMLNDHFTKLALIFCCLMTAPSASYGSQITLGVTPVYFQQTNTLSSSVMQSLQERFQGRIVGIRQNTTLCKPIEQHGRIDGKKQSLTRTVCQNLNGKWHLSPFVDVKILKRNSQVIIVTVHQQTGQIIKVDR